MHSKSTSINGVHASLCQPPKGSTTFMEEELASRGAQYLGAGAPSIAISNLMTCPRRSSSCAFTISAECSFSAMYDFSSATPFPTAALQQC